MFKKNALIAFPLAAAGVVLLVTQSGRAQQPIAGPFTAQQSAAGRAAYATNCAACHGADLSGQGSAAALSGGLFMGGWGDKTAGDLVNFLLGAMPPGNPGGLGEATYLNIAAFILESNGSRAG